MCASGRSGGILCPVLVILLAAGGFFFPYGAAQTAEMAQAAAVPAGTSAAQDDDSSEDDLASRSDSSHQPPFNVGSIAGTFASTNIGRDGQFAVADLGVFTFDGSGSFSGTVNVNLPGQDFTTRIPDFRSSFTGTYKVSPDGTGTTTTKFTLPGGSTRQTSSHFVITKAVVLSGQRIAKEFKLVADDLSVTSGNLDVAVLQKIPNGGFQQR